MEVGGPNPELDAKLRDVVSILRDDHPCSGYAEDLIAAVEQARIIIANVAVPGWLCDNPACRLFNGDGRFHLQACRGCGEPRR